MAIPKEEAQQIAETTLMYLGGSNALFTMIGATNFSCDNEGSLLFKFKVSKKYNVVKFVLGGDDLYTMQFYKTTVRRPECEPRKEIEGLFFDQLKEAFEQETGLVLSVPRLRGFNC